MELISENEYVPRKYFPGEHKLWFIFYNAKEEAHDLGAMISSKF